MYTTLIQYKNRVYILYLLYSLRSFSENRSFLFDILFKLIVINCKYWMLSKKTFKLNFFFVRRYLPWIVSPLSKVSTPYIFCIGLFKKCCYTNITACTKVSFLPSFKKHLRMKISRRIIYL